jgi:Site-specific recombinase XerD
MDKVLYNVVFNRKNRLLANGTALIQIEAYLKGKKKYFSTNIYITPDQWDRKHRTIKNHPNQISLNKQIKEFANSLENAEMQRRQSGKPFTLDYLADYIKGNCSNLFLDFCRRELANSTLRHKSVEQHWATFNHLERFRKDIQFEHITFEFLTDFEKYLRDLKLQQNTLLKHFSIIRRYVNLAIDKELFDLNKYPFRKYRIKRGKAKRDFLTPEELERIENLRLSKEDGIYQLALDKFLFAAYTGMRFSDVAALKPENLVVIDGKEWIVTIMQKTGDQIRIPAYLLFNGKALDIVYKYVGGEHTIFPFQKNVLVNKHLEVIARLANIKKRVTYHVARHTQATYLLYKGVNITTVQKLLGHRRIETTQIYGKVMDMTIINDLQNVSFSR